MTEPRTTAGLNLWEWFESDALPIDEFGFTSGKDAIAAIEREALAGASYLPITEMDRLRSIERAARDVADCAHDLLVACSPDAVTDDPMTALAEALETFDAIEGGRL